MIHGATSKMGTEKKNKMGCDVKQKIVGKSVKNRILLNLKSGNRRSNIMY